MPPKRAPLAELEANASIQNSLSRGVKRSADEAVKLVDTDEDDDNNGVSSSGRVEITHNCDQIRRKINTFIDNGGMKVGEFCKAINVNTNSYYRFMKQHGPMKGSETDAYISAMRFFQVREKKGLPMPKKRKTAATGAKAADEKNAPEGFKTVAAAASSKSQSDKAAKVATAMDEIKLAGEETDSVPVWDSCNEIRRKIGAHLRNDGVTHAAFLRDLSAQYKAKPRKLTAAQLSLFRGKKGPVSGNASGIYYASYVFFEKQRLAEKKGKSQHRLDMEDAWATEGGVPTNKVLDNQYYTCGPGFRVYQDPKTGQARSYPTGF